MGSLRPFLARTHIAYFTMEMAIRPEVHSYAGGLGVLAGDTARTCADLELPVVFVTLVSRAGYFRQVIDAQGRQLEQPDWWQPGQWCQALDAMVAVAIEGRAVWVRPWLYVHRGDGGREVPILLLDTDLDQNAPDDREITHYLYGGDEAYRLKQEAVLGLGGTRLLRALGFRIRTWHLNEGHAALLALELLERSRPAPRDGAAGAPPCDVAAVRARCLFTTHTPVDAAQDRFPYPLFERLLPDLIEPALLRELAGSGGVNMTQLALSLSGWVNGVSARHARTTEQRYPGRRVHAITNGVHVGTWTHEAFARLYRAHWPQWQHEPELLARAGQLDDGELWRCHEAAKQALIERVHGLGGPRLDPERPILVIARRMTAYKRPLLLFSDRDRLAAIAARHPFQVVIAGKAHPRDEGGKDAIRHLHEVLRALPPGLDAVFLPNHEIDLAKTLVAGADVWLNTPLPPMEASGTSGMKAALNGVLNLSVLDGWWLEACADGINGWAIGTDGGNDAPQAHAAELYRLLDEVVLPLYAHDRARWRTMMKEAIRTIASYFNSQRMMRRYASEVYLR
ncbi:alpha-glucan family phosphorylase [Aquabacterium humicola]|uniref:alpha-glucan family phosphorylase n=1 Tax=Aquabacterium humicola TaxID=3237377 RepID=UPI00254290C1|nr:alpha-glucan family phosphorylase [Rubrivivax pictus]